MEFDFGVFAQYGLAGVLCAVLGAVMWKIGLRMVASIDKLTERGEKTSEAGVEALYALAARVQHLETKFDTILEWRERSTSHLIPTGIAGAAPATVHAVPATVHDRPSAAAMVHRTIMERSPSEEVRRARKTRDDDR